MEEDVSEEHDDVALETGWGEVTRRTGRRYASASVLWLTVMLVAAGIAIEQANVPVPNMAVGIAVAVLGIGGLIGLLGAAMFPVRVWEERQELQRQVRLADVHLALERLGEDAPAGIEPTRGEKLRQVLYDQRLGLAMGGLLELIPLAIVGESLSNATAADLFNWANLRFFVAYGVVVSFIPATAAYAIWKEMRRGESKTMETARAERRLREAVKDHAQLAGGLVLDEHASGRVGGELTMRQEVGGLEVHEEVALGLDEAEASVAEAVVESEAVSH